MRLHVAQVAELDHIAHGLLHFAAGHALQGGAVAQVLIHAHVGVERCILRQVAEVPPRFDRLLEDVEPGNGRASGGGRQIAGEDLHRRALARAIRPEKANDFAFFHLEVEAVDRGDARVSLGEVFDFDHGE
ncbi:MAG: hypothetical protein WDN28_01310 [Chthoniobacter sp.]